VGLKPRGPASIRDQFAVLLGRGGMGREGCTEEEGVAAVEDGYSFVVGLRAGA
jgi:hypothetical protein